jgi:hypothetical protein
MPSGVIAASSVILLAILLYPIVEHLELPPDYPNRHSPHPASPHTPPRLELNVSDITAFRRDGLIVLRQVLSAELAAKLVLAGNDLMQNRTRHCELTKLTGPPIFHGYERYCGRAHLIHDHLRDIVYRSPLAHVAAQLLGSSNDVGGAGGDNFWDDGGVDGTTSSKLRADDAEQPIIRLWADVFMAGAQIPKRWHSDFLSFVKFAKDKRTTNPCQRGVVFWLPLETSFEESNGLILLNQSSANFRQHFDHHPARAHNLFWYMQWLRSLPKDDVVAPKLNLSDVIAFDACCVHTSSGKYPPGGKGGGAVRRAYQLRFMKDFELNPLSSSSSWWQRLLFPTYAILPVASPQLWPHTRVDEDEIRTAGHVIYSKADWVRRLTRGPVYTLVSCALALRTRIWGDSGESIL